MSSNQSLGDFFLRLGILPDKNSFETGNKLIDSVSNSMFKLMGTARNTAAVLATTAIITGKIESAELKTASALGISTKALDTWKAALKIAGGDANAFISSMSALDTKLAKLRIDGTMDKGLATNLGLLGLNYGEIAEMDADTRTQKIIEAAKMLDDQKKASIIVGDILGSAGRDFYEYMRLTGQSLNQVLGKAEGSIFTDENSKLDALGFTTEWNTFKTSTESILARIGSDLGKELEGPLSKANEWINKNGDKIIAGIDSAVAEMGKITEMLSPYIEKAAEGIAKFIGSDTTKEAVDIFGNTVKTAVGVPGQVISGDWGGLWESFKAITVSPFTWLGGKVTGATEKLLEKDERIQMQQYLSALVGIQADQTGKVGKLKWDDLDPDVQNQINELGGKKKFSGYIQDGIIRPNGQVTQVAPDDWVFAARDVGDLARAFTPQESLTGPNAGGDFIRSAINEMVSAVGDLARAFTPQGATATAGNNQYTISQNFTIGNSNMMPQTIRQMAYEGTRNGIEEISYQASRRMQMMPGTK